MQRLVVLWLIARYRLSYSKSLKLDAIKQVIMTTATRLGLIEYCQTAAEDFPVVLTDIAKRVKAAAGMYFDIPLFEYPYSGSTPSSTERALRVHWVDMLTA